MHLVTFLGARGSAPTSSMGHERLLTKVLLSEQETKLMSRSGSVGVVSSATPCMCHALCLLFSKAEGTEGQRYINVTSRRSEVGRGGQTANNTRSD